jgi:putative ABC transport system substrate-binding protein
MSQSARRRFVLSAGALVAIPRIAVAQQGRKVWHVGYIGSSTRAPYMDEFPKAMRELGYEPGKNLVIEWRFADGDFDRLPALAKDLVDKRVDVIVGGGTPATRAAQQATSTIPIVMAVVGDPVGSRFVASLARPGGNITGLSLANAEVSTKWFELARSISRQPVIGVLADANQPTAEAYVKNIQGAAQKLGVQVPVAYAPTGKEIDSAFASLAKERVAVVIVLPSGMLETYMPQVAQAALKYRMASVGTTRRYAETGALLAYGQSYAAFNRRAAIYVDKIFKGAKPSELSVEQPIIFELVVNKATAKQLDITIPKEILLRADSVIE